MGPARGLSAVSVTLARAHPSSERQARQPAPSESYVATDCLQDVFYEVPIHSQPTLVFMTGLPLFGPKTRLRKTFPASSVLPVSGRL